MQFSFQLSLAELAEANRAHQIALNFVRRYKRVFLLAMLALLGLKLMMKSPAPQPAEAPPAAETSDPLDEFLPPVLTGGGFLVVVLVRKKKIRQALESNLQMRHPTDFVLDQQGLRSETAISSQSMQWAALQKFIETDHLFVVYPFQHQLYILPKRVLSADQLAEVRALLQARSAKAA